MSKNQQGQRVDRVNPNMPSQIEQRASLEAAVDEVAGKTVRQTLPDDPEILKDRLVALIETSGKADAELEDLRREVTLARSKLSNMSRLEGEVRQELRLTESRWKPLVGYFDEETGIDCRAAPIGSPNRPTQVAIMIMQDGKPIHMAVTSEKVAIMSDGKGRWMLK